MGEDEVETRKSCSPPLSKKLMYLLDARDLFEHCAGRKSRMLDLRCFVQNLHQCLRTRMSAMVWFVGSWRQEPRKRTSNAIASSAFSYLAQTLFLSLHIMLDQRRSEQIVY